MEQTHGTWGERLRTFRTNDALITLLFLKSGNRCSWHKHVAAFNKFTVASGKIGILTDKGYETILTAKQEFTVDPGVKHEFRVYEDSIVEEIAYVQYDEHDIQRETLGGPLNG
jgi:quercetin dioxygenase-like cupin family protein